MREKRVEKHLAQRVEDIGGVALKLISPGVVGIPDRLVLIPGGKMAFVELKAPGKKPTAIQTYRMGTIEALGFRCFVIDSLEGVSEFIKEMGGDAL